MTAKLIPFSVRQSPEWPAGRLGEEMEQLARCGYESSVSRGYKDTMEAARRRVLDGMRELEGKFKQG